MEFAEVVRRRRMVRTYADTPVSEAVVDAVVDAAVQAPSAGFTQGVEFLVLDQPAAVTAFWAAAAPTSPGEPASEWLRGMQTAPVLLVVWTSERAYADRYAAPDKCWADRDPDRWSAPYWFVDAGMAAMALLLAAVDAGLGAGFFGVPPTRVTAVREAFGVPSDQLSVGVVSLGHRVPGEPVTGSAARRPRRPRADLVHRGRWTG